MTRRSTLPLSLLAAVVLACGGQQRGPAAVSALYEAGIELGTTREGILARHGQPESVEVRTAKNLHVPGAVDSLFTLRYDGLTFHLNRPGPVERDLLTKIRLMNQQMTLPGGLRIGETRSADATKRLGAPDAVDSVGDTIRNEYAVPGLGAENRVALLFVADTLVGVRWMPYVD